MHLPILLSIIIIFIISLLGIAFFTLLERKILGYIQIRKGPNKVGVIGILQPFADAVKLFCKEIKHPFISNFSPLIIAPIIALFLSLLLWFSYPFYHPSFILYLGVLIFLCTSSLNVYTLIGAGWISNSKYSLLGALRAIAQTISYEVRIVLVIITPLIIISSLNFYSFITSNLLILFIISPPFIIWLTTILAETNRTPFDFAEGESELVSGFNTEYRRGIFALIFIAEYNRILAMSFFSSLLFLPTHPPLLYLTAPTLIIITLAIFFIWARGTLPRIRYDRLINLTWKSFLPFILAFLIILPPLFIFYHAGRTDNFDEVKYES